MKSRYALAVDLGTTNCKAVLVDENAAVVERTSTEYPLTIPQPGWAEQHPGLWWEAVCRSVKTITARADRRSIKVVGLSGQMHGLVLLNRAMEPLRPAILWNDQRSAAYCSTILAKVGGRDQLAGYTGNTMLPGYLGGKLLWLKDHEPRSLEQASVALLPKDYIRFRFCGDVATDLSDASGTGLFDVRKQCWSVPLMQEMEVPLEMLPAVRPAASIAGSIPAQIAEDVGLPVGTPVVTGGGDAVMQTVGAGAVGHDIVLVVIGTGGNVTVTVDQPDSNSDGRLQLFCHVLDRKWVLMGVSLTAGSSLRWFRDALAGPERTLASDLLMDTYELLTRQAALSPPGSNGVLFVPYLQGERCPHPDAEARGSWLGLSLGTSKADLIRSIMEGVCFSLCDILELICQAGVTPKVIHASGGGANSVLWRQILANITQREVRTLQSGEDAAALGAALIAGTQIGFWTSAEEAASRIRVTTTEQADPRHAALYRALHAIYRKQYAQLKPTYHELHGLSAG